MRAEREEIPENLQRLLERGNFRKLTTSVNNRLFGNEVTTYRSPSMKIRLVKDRGQWSIQLGPATVVEEWYDLDDVLSVATGRPVDLGSPNLQFLSEALSKKFDQVQGIFDNYREIERDLEDAAGARSRALMARIFPGYRLGWKGTSKARLVEAVRQQLGSETSKTEAERAVTAVINAVKVGVKKDKIVQLVGFGTFKVVQRKARKGFNPKTLQQIRIPKSKTVKFVPGKDFKSKI